MPLPRIGITEGDPSGIGPEISAKAAADPRVQSACEPVLYRTSDRSRFEPGRLSADAGRAAFDAIRRALHDAQLGAIAAMTTAPINKEALALAVCFCPPSVYENAHSSLVQKFFPDPDSLKFFATLVRYLDVLRDFLGTGKLNQEAWKQVEAECRRTNAPRYDAQVNLAKLRALKAVAEGDNALFNEAIATLVERHSRFVLLIALPEGHRAELVADALAARITALPAQLRRSITWDQGKEMAAHAQFSVKTGVPALVSLLQAASPRTTAAIVSVTSSPPNARVPVSIS